MSFYRVRPTSLRYFPLAALPPHGDTPSQSYTAAGSYFVLLPLLLKELFLVLRPVFSCTMTPWLLTIGSQRQSVHEMLALHSPLVAPLQGGGTPGSYRASLHCENLPFDAIPLTVLRWPYGLPHPPYVPGNPPCAPSVDLALITHVSLFCSTQLTEAYIKSPSH